MHGNNRLTWAAFTSSLIFALLGCSSQTSEPETSSEAPTNSPAPAQTDGELESKSDCADLLRQGWEPATGEIEDVSFDPSTGIGILRLVGDEPINFASTDPLCSKLPVVGSKIAEFGAAASEAKESECRELVRELNGPENTQREGRPAATREDLYAYFAETCPESITKVDQP